MSSEKYIGLDVHQATISVAVLDSRGKLVMESIVETKAATILDFFAGLRGTLSVTFEEGTWAAWLYDLLKPHISSARWMVHSRCAIKLLRGPGAPIVFHYHGRLQDFLDTLIVDCRWRRSLPGLLVQHRIER